MRYEGSCHCGAIRLRLTLSWPPGEAPVRACDCSFCRAHGARTVTDPSGSVEIDLKDAPTVHRYRFALKTADYLVCGNCGVYVAALADTPKGLKSTVNVNALNDHALFDAHPPLVHYDEETAAARLSTPRRALDADGNPLTRTKRFRTSVWGRFRTFTNARTLSWCPQRVVPYAHGDVAHDYR